MCPGAYENAFSCWLGPKFALMVVAVVWCSRQRHSHVSVGVCPFYRVSLDSRTTKPTLLDWVQVVVFNSCLHFQFGLQLAGAFHRDAVSRLLGSQGCSRALNACVYLGLTAWKASNASLQYILATCATSVFASKHVSAACFAVSPESKAAGNISRYALCASFR